jgi:hypothetical protein
MMHSGRKLLYSAARVHAMFSRMRGELDHQHFRHLSEMADLRRELDQVRGQFEVLCNAVRERERAEAEVEMLKRTRAVIEGEARWLH